MRPVNVWDSEGICSFKNSMLAAIQGCHVLLMTGSSQKSFYIDVYMYVSVTKCYGSVNYPNVFPRLYHDDGNIGATTCIVFSNH